MGFSLGNSRFEPRPEPATYFCHDCMKIMLRHERAAHDADHDTLTLEQPEQSVPMGPRTHTQQLDDLNERIDVQTRRLAETHQTLLNAIAYRREAYQGLNTTPEWEERLRKENYLLIRCQEMKSVLKQLERERTDFVCKTLGLDPDTDLPIFSD
jgi:NAD-dependent SIR2 family protein deacetylase